MGTPFDVAAPQTMAGQKFADDVFEATGGKVKINFFTNSAIGTERDQMIAVAADDLEFTIGGVLIVDMYAPDFGFLSAPYLYKDNAHMKNLVDSPVCDPMRAKFIENNVNMMALVMKGARHTSSNRPIYTPDDLIGLKIRMTELPTWISIWGEEGLGAVTVPSVLGEL
jgi:TRAP-type C4-dicarboxylate transport system substrate-binding protein